jgi:hypothetical protein
VSNSENEDRNEKPRTLLLAHGEVDGLIGDDQIPPLGLAAPVEDEHLVRERGGLLVPAGRPHAVLERVVGVVVDVVELVLAVHRVALALLLALEQIGGHLPLLQLVLSRLPVPPGLLDAERAVVVLPVQALFEMEEGLGVADEHLALTQLPLARVL